MPDLAELRVNGQSIQLPLVVGSENETAIDINDLRDKTGLVTLDKGYKNTGATKSAITFLDGELGILRYRGYPIEQLAEKSSFLEVAYLLIYGELPTQTQLSQFEHEIRIHTLVNEDTKKIFDGFPVNAHPMGVLSSLVCSLTAFYPEAWITRRPSRNTSPSSACWPKMPTIAAWAYKNQMKHPVNYPKNSLDYCSNFLYMMFALPVEEYQVNPVVVDALNKLLILHADHEQNCSTSTVRLVGSSRASLYSSVSAGINALWGPLHGGANQEVIEMLEAIRADGGDTSKYIKMAKDKSSNFRLMGFGTGCTKTSTPAPRSSRLPPTRCSTNWASTTRYSTLPSNSKKPPSRTPTSWNASCTRTWTSTPASSTGPWASPPICSR
jgi:citrate synthase